LTNNGSGGFFGASAPSVPLGTVPYSVTVADVNGDGRPDLISANSNTNKLSVVTNSSGGHFVFVSSPVIGSGSYSVAAADVNGDGKVDLVCANQSGNTLSVLVNAPTLTSTLSTNSVIISWPTPWIGWNLQQNTNLATTNWAGFSGTVGNNGTTKSATNSPPTGNKFFRLAYP
jgi:hypothetical protein